MKQYQIVLVNLDPAMGSEIRKTRPCVIISPDEMNRHLRTLIVAPVTSRSKNYPTRIKVQVDDKSGWLVIDQIRTIDKQRVVKSFGRLKDAEIESIRLVIKETFVDP
ncbi:MAG: type II toxin-antitoxin system PemK/MazF family toxin [Bacteroidales bacterium]